MDRLGNVRAALARFGRPQGHREKKDRRGHWLTIAGSAFFGMWMSVSLVAEWKQLTNLALY